MQRACHIIVTGPHCILSNPKFYTTMKTNNKPQPEIDNPLYSEEAADMLDRASRLIFKIAIACFLICIIGSIYKSTHAHAAPTVTWERCFAEYCAQTGYQGPCTDSIRIDMLDEWMENDPYRMWYDSVEAATDTASINKIIAHIETLMNL